MQTKFKDFLNENQILINEPMKKHTTFKTGGNADLLLLPKNIEQIKKCIEICTENNFKFFILGNGSNLLVSDKGFRGIIIKISKNFSDVTINENKITAQAGATLSKISSEALNNSLKNFEFASGIPGTAGGAICMNAGAYGGEMKDVVTKVTVLYNNKIISLTNKECGFEYRNSNIFEKNMVVLEIEITLEKGEYAEIKSIMEDLKNKRKEKQPLEFPSAGSTFKRPKNNFAGKLIMDSGLAGYCIGDAQVSEKHCGFLINKGNAKTADILELIKYVKEKVYTNFNVMLEEEVKIIGDFS